MCRQREKRFITRHAVRWKEISISGKHIPCLAGTGVHSYRIWGSWRDIFIDSYEKAELSDLHIRQEHIDGKVFLSAETKVMLPEKAQDGEIAEAEYLVLPQSAESNARILKESVGNNDSNTGRECR